MLRDRVILVTGSGAGIGFATARVCKEYGAKIVLHGPDAVQMDDAAKQLGSDVFTITSDLSEPSSPQFIVDSVIKEFGRIDGLVNNAARLDRCTIETMTDDLFDKMLDINLRAPLKLIQAALPYMKAQNSSASIVNIGSTNAHCGAPNLLLYSATKAALMTATRNLADCLVPNLVRINQLNVGWTLTEGEHMLQLAEGRPEDWLDNIPHQFAPSGTIMRPQQIAEHVAFWLSQRSAPVTGQVYEVEQYPLIGRNGVSER